MAAAPAQPSAGGDLASVNTQLTAQLSALQKEFMEYREAADKLVAELQRAGGGVSPTATTATATAAAAASRRIHVASSTLPRGSSRLAKLGLEDPDDVAALKAQLARLQERADALAAHLDHAQLIASRAVQTTAELKAQNVELKAELMTIAGEFESYKDVCSKALEECEAEAVRAAEEIAALRAALEAARRAAAGAESPAQALVRENLSAEARVAVLEAQLLTMERDLQSAQQEAAAALEKREAIKKSLTSIVDELKQQLTSVVEEYLSYKAAATAAATAADTARAEAEEALATHLRGCRGADTAALQARIDELEGYTKSAYTEFSAMTKKLADEKVLSAQKDKRIAELETNGAAAKGAAEAAALAQELADTRAASAQRVTALEAAAAAKDSELAALKLELKDTRDKLLKLAMEYQGYKSETSQKVDSLQAAVSSASGGASGGGGGADVAELRRDLGAARSDLSDARRQLSLVDVQKNEMHRLLWTMREAATAKGVSVGAAGEAMWREVMGDAAADPSKSTAAAGSGSD